MSSKYNLHFKTGDSPQYIKYTGAFTIWEDGVVLSGERTAERKPFIVRKCGKKQKLQYCVVVCVLPLV